MSNRRLLNLASSLAAGASLLGVCAPPEALAQTASTPVDQQNAAPTTSAQDSGSELPTVYVTAQRRTERQTDVPITITALSAEDLSRAGIDTLDGIAQETPALRFDYSGAFPQPTIRGVGSAVITAGAGSNVGIYVDGFYNPAPLAADFQLLKEEDIQVLKGPQGTLFGHNTTGGAILVNTAEPSHDTSAMVDGSYGNYNDQRYEGYFTTGVTSGLAVDAAGILSRGDGYVHDILTGSDKDGAYQNWSLRLGAKADVTDNLSFLLRYLHTDTHDPGSLLGNAYVKNGQPLVPGAVIPGSVYATEPNQVVQDGNVDFTARSDAFQLTGKADVGIANLTSYTQYYRLTSNHSDEDLSYTSIPVSATAYAPYFHVAFPVTDKLVTQEFLLNSKAADRLKWTAGLFYMDYSEQFGPVGAIFTGIPANTGGSGTNTMSVASYFDATYQLLEKLYLTAGARYSFDDVQNAFFYNAALVQTDLPDLNGHKLSPRAVLRYALTPASSAYFSFSRGYKSAIYNVGGQSTTPVKPETISAYELGYKFAAGPLSFDLATYHYDYKDLQVAAYTDVNGVPASEVNNAATSRINGAEGQVQYKIGAHFQVDAGAAYVDAKYLQFNGSPVFGNQCSAPISATQLYCVNAKTGGVTPLGFFASSSLNESNTDMVRAPHVTANLGARYMTNVLGGDFALSGNLYYTSKFYFDSSDQYSQADYALLGLRAQWTNPSHRYSLGLYGDNVTDTHYLAAMLPNNPGIGAYWGKPATFGGQVSVYF